MDVVRSFNLQAAVEEEHGRSQWHPKSPCPEIGIARVTPISGYTRGHNRPRCELEHSPWLPYYVGSLSLFDPLTGSFGPDLRTVLDRGFLMRRFLVVAAGLPLLLIGCGGSSETTTAIPSPAPDAAAAPAGPAVAAQHGAMPPGAAQPGGAQHGAGQPEGAAAQPAPGMEHAGAQHSSGQGADGQAAAQHAPPGSAESLASTPPGQAQHSSGSGAPPASAQHGQHAQQMQQQAQQGQHQAAQQPTGQQPMGQQAQHAAAAAGGATAPGTDGAAGNPGGEPGSQGGGYEQAKLPSFPDGSAEKAVQQLILKVTAGDTTGLDELISEKADGVLKELRDGTISEDKLRELKESWGQVRSVNVRQVGGGKEILLQNAKGTLLPFQCHREHGAYRVRDYSEREPTTRRRAG